MVQKENRVNLDAYSYFSNDSLKLNAQFYGDYVLVNKNDSDYQRTIKNLSKIIEQSKIKTRNITPVLMKTNTDPWFYSALVLVEKPFVKTPSWTQVISQARYFDDKYSNSQNFDVRLVNLDYEIKSKHLVWLTWIDHKENYDSVLKKETDFILETFKFDENHSNFIPVSPFNLANQAFIADEEEGGNYLQPYKKLIESENNYNSTSQKDFYQQALDTYKSFLSINDKNRFNDTKLTNVLKSTESIKNKAARDFLIKKCSENQVVMFNETHKNPEQRYFVSTLLDTLYKLNFRVLSLEAFQQNSLFSTDKPTLKSGFYLREPQMSNLVRHALSIGFKVIGYEDTSSSSTNREKSQAENLIAATLKNNPNEKVVLLGGGSHIQKKTKPNEKRWMASYFKEMTGIEPLTINQTLGNIPFSDDNLMLFNGKDLSNRTGNNFSDDFYLINRTQADEFKLNPEEPDCSFILKFKIDEKKRIENQYVFLVYLASEFNQLYKLPIFTQLIDASKKEIKLKFPKGEYVLVVKNSIGQTLFKGSTIIGTKCKISE